MPSAQQTSHQDQFVMELLDLHSGGWNNPELSELVRGYYVEILKTREFCAALPAHLGAHHESLIHGKYDEAASASALEHFFHELSRVYDQQLRMLEALQSFDSRFVEELDRISYWKKASAASCTAAAATSAAVAAANANLRRAAVAAAAAAASILFGALGKWIHALLTKRESSVKKHKVMIRLMFLSAKITVEGLSSIYALASSLQLETESLSETVDDGKKAAAVTKSFQELQWKANDTSSVGALGIQTLFKHLDGN